MLSLRQPDAFRRRIGGVALIGTMVTLLASELFGPRGAGGNSELLTAVAADRTGFVVSTLLLLVSTILLIPAVMAVLHLVRDRAPVIGHVAGVFGMLGALGHMAVVCYGLFVAEMADGGSRSEMVSLLDRLDSGLAAVVVPLILSFALAVLLMGIALYRARVAPRWVMLAAIAAVVVELGAPGGTLAAALVKQTLVVVAFGAVGVRVLRMSDAQWRSRAALAYAAPRGAEPAVAS
jgi:Domain of unknown function (DUF4386)